MPKRAVIYGVQVFREGKLVSVKAGTMFNFTADEITDIKNANPKALRPVPVEDLDAEAKLNETPEQREARVQQEQDEALRIQTQNEAAVKQKEIDDANARKAQEAADKAAKDAETAAKAAKSNAKGAGAKAASASADSL